MIKYCHYFKELIIYFGNLLIYIRKIKLLGVNIFFLLVWNLWFCTWAYWHVYLPPLSDLKLSECRDVSFLKDQDRIREEYEHKEIAIMGTTLESVYYRKVPWKHSHHREKKDGGKKSFMNAGISWTPRSQDGRTSLTFSTLCHVKKEQWV